MRLRFTLTLLLFSFIPNAPAAHPQSGDKDVAELRAYTLNMDNVTRIYTAMYEIKQAADKDPNLQKSMNADTGDDKGSQSLASITARFSAYPSIVGIIANNHFTPHEFVVAQLSVIQAGMAMAALKMGAPKDKLISEGAVSAANLNFVQQHEAEFEELGKRYPMQ